MKHFNKSLILFILITVSSLADEYFVISNKNMKDLSSKQIKAIFLKKISFVDDLKVIPVNLEPRNELRLKFEQEILQMSFSRLKIYWTNQHYLGKRSPISMKSEESVKAFVKKVDGSLGYIRAEELDSSLKVVYKWSD